MKQLIKNCRVFDGCNEALKEQAYIVIEDNLVLEIGTGAVSEERFERVMDAGNRVVIPGLID